MNIERRNHDHSTPQDLLTPQEMSRESLEEELINLRKIQSISNLQWCCSSCGSLNPSIINSKQVNFCLDCSFPRSSSNIKCWTEEEPHGMIDVTAYKSISLELLKKMLIRENELRLSKEIQEAYARAEKTGEGSWMVITEELQKRVAIEFGFSDNISLGTDALRQATRIFPNHPELISLSLYRKYNRIRKGSLRVGDIAPNPQVVSLEGNLIPLYDTSSSKPLLVIGSSFSWPPMRGMIVTGQVDELFNQYKDKLNFLLVYILEAHAADEWPIRSARFCSKEVNYFQHQTLEERKIAALDFKQTYNLPFPMVLDQISNLFNDTYAAWPLRYFIIKDSHISFIAMPHASTYDLKYLKIWLENNISN